LIFLPKEVTEHNREDDAGDEVDEDLETQQVVHLLRQCVQIGMNSTQNIQLKVNIKYLHNNLF